MPEAEGGGEGGGEGGLLGLAVSPTFDTDSLVYVYFSTTTENRIERMPFDGAAFGPREPLVTGIPSAVYQDGGALEFGPDGMLRAGTGDATNGPLAQDPVSLAGKIQRQPRHRNIHQLIQPRPRRRRLTPIAQQEPHHVHPLHRNFVRVPSGHPAGKLTDPGAHSEPVTLSRRSHDRKLGRANRTTSCDVRAASARARRRRERGGGANAAAARTRRRRERMSAGLLTAAMLNPGVATTWLHRTATSAPGNAPVPATSAFCEKHRFSHISLQVARIRSDANSIRSAVRF